MCYTCKITFVSHAKLNKLKPDYGGGGLRNCGLEPSIVALVAKVLKLLPQLVKVTNYLPAKA